MRNSSLQGGYLILAARALGLDCGPMSGFDAAEDGRRVLGRHDGQDQLRLHAGPRRPEQGDARSPRLAFDEACRLA